MRTRSIRQLKAMRAVMPSFNPSYATVTTRA